MYGNERVPGVMERLMQAYQFAQSIKAGKYQEEDRALRRDQMARENARQDREESRTRTKDQLALHQMGARPVDSASMYAGDPHETVDIGAGQMYYLPTRDEEEARELEDYKKKSRVKNDLDHEDDVELQLDPSIARMMGIGDGKLKVPRQHIVQIANDLFNIANPNKHVFQTTNDSGDVTAYGIDPRSLKVQKGGTLYGAGKSKTEPKARGKAAYTAHDLDTEAEAQVLDEAQKQYGPNLLIEPQEVGSAIKLIKRDHPEFDDAAAREYLMRVGSRLPQFKGLFDERGKLHQEDYRKSAQFRKDMLKRRLELKQKYEKEASASSPKSNDAERQKAESAYQQAIERVNTSNLTPAKKEAAIAELRKLHEARWPIK